LGSAVAPAGRGCSGSRRRLVPSADRAGFTLLELSLVLLLIALMSGLVAPRLWSRLINDPLESSGRRLAGSIGQAGDLACREQRPVRLRLVGGTHVLLEDPASGKPFAHFDYIFPPEVVLRDFVALAGSRSTDEPQLLFSPKGTVGAATLTLADRRGRRLLLELEPFLGTVSLRRQDGRPLAPAL